MNTNSIPLHRARLERWTYEVAEFLLDAWARRQARREWDARVDAMADLNEHMLTDIGAPDELLNEAAARRDACVQRVDELRMLAGYTSQTGGQSRGW